MISQILAFLASGSTPWWNISADGKYTALVGDAAPELSAGSIPAARPLALRPEEAEDIR